MEQNYVTVTLCIQRERLNEMQKQWMQKKIVQGYEHPVRSCQSSFPFHAKSCTSCGHRHHHQHWPVGRSGNVHIGCSDVTETMAIYDRHVVGITRHIMCAVNGRRFIVLFKQHSIRWFTKMSVSLPTELISVISQWKTFIRVLPTRRRRKPAGIEITSPSPCVAYTANCTMPDRTTS